MSKGRLVDLITNLKQKKIQVLKCTEDIVFKKIHRAHLFRNLPPFFEDRTQVTSFIKRDYMKGLVIYFNTIPQYLFLCYFFRISD